MGKPVDFHGTNTTLTAAEGDEETVVSMRVFRNGRHVVSAWTFSPEEIAEIIRTKTIFVTVLSGLTSPPIYLGSESNVRAVCADTGVWKK